ncbi:PREDICTED: transcriptional regulator ATRX-like [Priapulus caudatus]|uniref:ATP-dependent helicase ATRX n=1 Tax=Priapulus caudatus TaxID=37621 RepID=A0ABM1EI49_PRICU|nr:PREDICTED: transcriptional regulator ATRX-like [Priapulus caudatus]
MDPDVTFYDLTVEKNDNADTAKALSAIENIARLLSADPATETEGEETEERSDSLQPKRTADRDASRRKPKIVHRNAKRDKEIEDRFSEPETVETDTSTIEGSSKGSGVHLNGDAVATHGEEDANISVVKRRAERSLSRRKPKIVLHHNLVVGTKDNGEGTARVERETGTASDRGRLENGDVELDEDGNPLLPEGTVIVNPEPVEESNLEFRGPEFDTLGIKHKNVDFDNPLANSVHCTVCNEQLVLVLGSNARRHPDLNVLICKKCHDFHDSGKWTTDDDGVDEFCRWCSQGGRLTCCDFCSNVFCRSCIKNNLGRGELRRLGEMDDDDKWRCYVCNPLPLSAQKSTCEQFFSRLDDLTHQKKQQKARAHAGRRVNATYLVGVIDELQTSLDSLTAYLASVRKEVAPRSRVKEEPGESDSSTGSRRVREKTGGGVVAEEVKYGVALCVLKHKKLVKKAVKSLLKPPKHAIPDQPPRPAVSQKREDSEEESARADTPANTPTDTHTDTPADTHAEPTSELKPVDDDEKGAPPSDDESVARVVELTDETSPQPISDDDDDVEQLADFDVIDETAAEEEEEGGARGSDAASVDSLRLTSGSRSVKVVEIPVERPTPVVIVLDTTIEEQPTSTDEQPASPLTTEEQPESPPATEEQAASPPANEEQPASPLETEEQAASPPATEEQPASPPETKEQPESPPANEEQPASPPVTEEQAASPPATEEQPASPPTTTARTTRKRKREAEEVTAVRSEAAAEADPCEEDTADGKKCEKKRTRREGEKLVSKIEEEKEEEEVASCEEKVVEASVITDDVGESEANVLDSTEQLPEDISKPTKNAAARKEEKKEEEDEGEDSVVLFDSDASPEKKKPKRVQRVKELAAEVKKLAKEGSDSEEEGVAAEEVVQQHSARIARTREDVEAERSLQVAMERELNAMSSDDDDVSATTRQRRGGRRGAAVRRDSKLKGNAVVSLVPLREDVLLTVNTLETKKKKAGRQVEKAERKAGPLSSKKAKAAGKVAGRSEEDSDSDIDKEIEKLAHVTFTKHGEAANSDTGEDGSDDDAESDGTKPRPSVDSKVTESKPKCSRKPKKVKEGVESSSSSDEGNNDAAAASEESEGDTVSTLKVKLVKGRSFTSDVKPPLCAAGKGKQVNPNEAAKDALKAEIAAELEAGSETSSSDEEMLVAEVKQKAQKQKKSAKKEEGDSDDKQKGGTTSDDGANSDSSDFVSPMKKSAARYRSKLLRVKLSESDSDDGGKKSKDGKTQKNEKKKPRKERTRHSSSEIAFSQSDSNDDSDNSDSSAKKLKKNKRKRSDTSSSDEDSKKKKKKRKKQKGKKSKKGKGKRRKRIKMASDSSGSESDEVICLGKHEGKDESPGKRKKLRKIWKESKLKEATKAAAKAEEDRRKRILERQKKYNHIEQFADESSPTKCPITTKLVLERDPKTKEPLVEVCSELVLQLKPHQVEGVQFMWDCLVETLDQLDKGEEGSGAILAHCMGLGKTLQVVTFIHTMLMNERTCGKLRTVLVVAPLNTVLNWEAEFKKWQVNIDEDEQVPVYELASIKDNWKRMDWCEGWYKNGGVMIMGYDMMRNLTSERVRNKRQKRIFNKCLMDPGERLNKKATASETKKQKTNIRTAETVREMWAAAAAGGGAVSACSATTDYQRAVQAIDFETARSAKSSTKNSDDEAAVKGGDKSDSSVEVVKTYSTRSRGAVNTRSSSRGNKDKSDAGAGPSTQPEPEVLPDPERVAEWWDEHISQEDEDNYELSGKMMLLTEILSQCEAIGDKVLLFSHSLLSLNMIEHFLKCINDKNDKLHTEKQAAAAAAATDEEGVAPPPPPEPTNEDDFIGTWDVNFDYFRMDGSTSPELRARWQAVFNDEDNRRARLFLISTKAGSLGVNLIGANRVIIFDASWNPTHDVQAIFRCYRFGQTKPVYIYRFLAQGTMEEKIYDNHQTWQSKQLTLTPGPMMPKDPLLAELLQNFKRWIVTYHEHDSLLENRPDEGLTEEERKAAWEEYENEKKGVFTNRGALPSCAGCENQVRNAGQEYDATDVTITSADMAKLKLELRVVEPQASEVDLQVLLQQRVKLMQQVRRHELLKRQQYFQQQQEHLRRVSQMQQQMRMNQDRSRQQARYQQLYNIMRNQSGSSAGYPQPSGAQSDNTRAPFNQDMMNHLTQSYLNRLQQSQATSAAKPAGEGVQPSTSGVPVPERSADGKTLKVGTLTITELDD